MWMNLGRELEKNKKVNTMYKLAKALGVPPTAISAYFKPGFDPKFSTVLRWCKAMHIGIEDLLDPDLDEEVKLMPRPKVSIESDYSGKGAKNKLKK